MAVLENRAEALAFREWEFDCAKKQFQMHLEKQHAAEALKIVSNVKRKLLKIQEEVRKAAQLVHQVQISDDAARKYVTATESLGLFIGKFEETLENRLMSPCPGLSLPPKAGQAFLSMIPNRPSYIETEEDNEFVVQLLSLSQSNKKKKQAAGGGGISPRDKSAIKEDAPRYEPLEINPLSTKASAMGMGGDEQLYSLEFDYDCEELNTKLNQKFQHAVDTNNFRSLRSNFSDISEPELPPRIQASVVCLPPLSNLAGRLPSCGLCGFTVKRDDYRGRALKNGVSQPCLVHTYHSFCLAYLRETCGGICVANMMGAASPCNLNERSRH